MIKKTERFLQSDEVYAKDYAFPQMNRYFHEMYPLKYQACLFGALLVGFRVSNFDLVTTENFVEAGDLIWVCDYYSQRSIWRTEKVLLHANELRHYLPQTSATVYSSKARVLIALAALRAVTTALSRC